MNTGRTVVVPKLLMLIQSKPPEQPSRSQKWYEEWATANVKEAIALASESEGHFLAVWGIDYEIAASKFDFKFQLNGDSYDLSTGHNFSSQPTVVQTLEAIKQYLWNRPV